MTHFHSEIRLFGNSIIRKTRKGFSLVELIVVIGIIGVLAGVLFTSFGGGTESARAAKCLNNLRNLAQGATAYAAGSKWERLPLAGSRTAYELSGGGGLIYREQVGWISWLSMNDEYGTRSSKKKKPTSFVHVNNATAYEPSDEKGLFALTNGTMWLSVNCNRDVYLCPEHLRKARKVSSTGSSEAGGHGGSRTTSKIWWSYVMNAYFGYDWSDGNQAVTQYGDKGRSPGNNDIRPERRLMFAELPLDGATDGTEADCILQYRAYEFNKDWKGTGETIAFNHKSAKRACAHVVFADGHAEKLLKPTSDSGVTEEQLTALLCAGKDVSFDGASYTWVNTQDKTE